MKKHQRANHQILQEIFTVRIHLDLDDCRIENGALRIIPKSHRNGIIQRQEITDKMIQSEKVCEVKKSGILLMKPMILHSSKRSENQLNRRGIHIEFSSKSLAQGVTWLEKQEIFTHNDH